MIKVAICGAAKSGRTALAQAIAKALSDAGVNVAVNDTDGDFYYYRPPTVLVGKQVLIEMQRLPLGYVEDPAQLELFHMFEPASLRGRAEVERPSRDGEAGA